MEFKHQMKTKSDADEEEDLEVLRLAALQSLKKRAAEESGNILINTSPSKQNFNGVSKGFRKRNRFYQNRNNMGQFNRSMPQFNSRVRSTNLIAITPVQTEEVISAKFGESDSPKLYLPQDRYSKPTSSEKSSEEPVSKFDRYDNSDKSESEDEEEDHTDDKLKRSDSLEELMKELEDEIQGESRKEKSPTKAKVKRKKSVSKTVVSENTPETLNKNAINSNDISQDIVKETSVVNKENSENIFKNLNSISQESPANNPEVNINPRKRFPDAVIQSLDVKHGRFHRSPNHRKTEFNRRTNRPFNSNPRFNRSAIPPIFNQQVPYPPFDPTPVINPLFASFIPTNIPPPSLQPNIVHNNRPISPLVIDTESLNAVITAPLSPRSAAFVLENRAIIEKRKRSPRRSYSRSPSPRDRSKSPRRSYSPRRSLSPKSRRSCRSSLSPRRFSRSPRRCSRSPRRSLTPPRKYSPPPRKYSPKRTKPQPQQLSTSKGSVYDRLGVKLSNNKTESKSQPTNEKNIKSNEKNVKPETTSAAPDRAKTPPIIDPVLEARRRKFETNEIKIKAGVIRLKPKDNPVDNVKQMELTKSSTSKKDQTESSVTKKPDPVVEALEKALDKKEESNKSDDDKLDGLSDINEDELLAGDEPLDLEAPIDHFLSDEESDDETEGRFKTTSEADPKVPILPFTKLTNTSKSQVRETSKDKEDRRHQKDDVRKSDRVTVNKSSSKIRSLTPELKRQPGKHVTNSNLPSKIKGTDESRNQKKIKLANRLLPKNRVTAKIDKPPLTTPIENKKIEIKIRNPGKYKRTESDEKNVDHLEKCESPPYSRKVEITKRSSSESSESETEIIVENESEDDTVAGPDDTTSSEGDLRTQLSRKRAERQLHPETERSSRLLQNALEGAVFKKSKRSRKEKEKKESQVLRRFLNLEQLNGNMNFTAKHERKVHFYEHFQLLCYSDVKLPIHLRLGLANSAEIYTVKKKKSKKHRKHGAEQV